MIGFYLSYITTFQQMTIMVLLALSFQVVLRTGVFSFASIGFWGIGAYAVADMAKAGIPNSLNLVVVALGAALIGYGMSYPLIRLRGLYLGMVTIAFDLILAVVATNGGSITGGVLGLFGLPLAVPTIFLFLIAGLAALLVSQLERRGLGRSLQALHVDEQLARSLGGEVFRQRAFIFALSATLGAMAGALNTITTSTVGPSGFGFNLIVTGLAMAIVGGVGSWAGAVIGAVFVAWFPIVFAFVGSYQSVVYGALMILVVVFEPAGAFGLLVRIVSLLHKVRGGRRPTDVPSTTSVVAPAEGAS